MFRALLELSQARHIRTQTNDRLLLVMLYDCATNITADNVLFADGFTTSLPCPRGALKRAKDKRNEEWVIECDGHIAASGGLLFHYNPPYGDVFMEVEERYRQQGFGSYLVQELKRIAMRWGRFPRPGAAQTMPSRGERWKRPACCPAGACCRATWTLHVELEEHHVAVGDDVFLALYPV